MGLESTLSEGVWPIQISIWNVIKLIREKIEILMSFFSTGSQFDLFELWLIMDSHRVKDWWLFSLSLFSLFRRPFYPRKHMTTHVWDVQHTVRVHYCAFIRICVWYTREFNYLYIIKFSGIYKCRVVPNCTFFFF